MDIHQRIIDYIKTNDWVSIVEIRQIVEREGIPVSGNYGWEVQGKRNCCMWAGASQELLDILDAVIHSPDISCWRGSVTAYLVDGMALRMPIAKRIPAQGYALPRWLPVSFRPATKGKGNAR